MNNNLSDKDKKAFAIIRNKIMHHGESPSLREINEVTGGKSPRSASIVLQRLVNAGLIVKVGKKFNLASHSINNSINTIKVPLLGSVACGSPMFAESNIQAFIPVSTSLAKKGSEYFFLRAKGDSMNLAGINPEDLLLVRQQETAELGDKVVALIDDEATVKVFDRHDEIVILRPKSRNPIHKPIILTNNCIIQGVVVAVLPSDIK
jgi:repressor LexA